MEDDQIKKDEIATVDLKKGASRDFEIKTMADDLKEAQSNPPPPSESIDVLKEELIKEDSSLKPPEFLLGEEQKSGWIKSFLVGFLVVLILGGIGIGSWWYLQNRKITSEPPPPPPPITPVTDTPFIPVDKSITLELSSQETRQSFFSKLSSLIQTSTPDFLAGQLIRIIPIRENKLLTLGELGTLVEIEVPADLFNERFTLVFFLQAQPVMGLVTKVSDPFTFQAYVNAKESEAPLLVNELYTEYTKTPLPQALSQTFLEHVYQGVSIRYLNFGSPQLSLDYGFFDDLLLIGGSREAMFTLIDRAKLGAITNPALR